MYIVERFAVPKNSASPINFHLDVVKKNILARREELPPHEILPNVNTYNHGEYWEEMYYGLKIAHHRWEQSIEGSAKTDTIFQFELSIEYKLL